MGRPRAQDIVRSCENCQKDFVTRDTKRGRERRTCSKSCASQLAVAASLIEGTCSVCGEKTQVFSFTKNASLPTYCSAECKSQKYLKECEWCKTEFRTGRSGNMLCSRDCITEWNRNNLVDVVCECCGKNYQQASFSLYSGKRNFCSKTCNMRIFSRENPMRYGGTWPRWVRTIKARDNNRCIKCGSSEDLQVHHFIKMTSFDDPNDSHYNENLGLFCLDCHKEIENLGIDSLTEFYGRYSPTPHEIVGGKQK